VWTTVQSTRAAVCTMDRVRLRREYGSAKYEFSRDRRLLALPT
jgi:hypothetical protein